MNTVIPDYESCATRNMVGSESGFKTGFMSLGQMVLRQRSPARSKVASPVHAMPLPAI